MSDSRIIFTTLTRWWYVCSPQVLLCWWFIHIFIHLIKSWKLQNSWVTNEEVQSFGLWTELWGKEICLQGLHLPLIYSTFSLDVQWPPGLSFSCYWGTDEWSFKILLHRSIHILTKFETSVKEAKLWTWAFEHFPLIHFTDVHWGLTLSQALHRALSAQRCRGCGPVPWGAPKVGVRQVCTLLCTLWRML